ncbi:TIGR04255 family protein [Crenothrix sp.]|uniref:TIGR04255 family protein n=1 Tax=Crenothrix sp. TaxID=3100433 RepID=UPI00374CAE11
MKKRLPKKLNKEPLLEALLEVRFTCDLSASTILPGLLFGKLDGNKSIEQLSTAQIPTAIREADPNLRFAPVYRLIWKQFHINIGDKSISIGCQSPDYPGWVEFKKAILDVVDILIGTNIIHSIERYSIKYVNLIPADSLEEQASLINCDIAIASHKVSKDAFQLRVEIHEDNFINIISVMSSAEILLPDHSIKKGVVVDIDTIVVISNEPLDKVFENLESTRQLNKAKFFDCLTQKTIDSLEPTYE